MPELASQYSGLLVYGGFIYADLNISRFENLLVIAFVFPRELFSASYK
jgi:hypothetical protein